MVSSKNEAKRKRNVVQLRSAAKAARVIPSTALAEATKRVAPPQGMPGFLTSDPRFHFGRIPWLMRIVLMFRPVLAQYTCDDGIVIRIRELHGRWYVTKHRGKVKLCAAK